jgi:hypothetical protein
LLLPAAGADGLVVEADRRVQLRVFIKPLGIDGIGKGRARAVDEQLRLRSGLRGEPAAAAQQEEN